MIRNILLDLDDTLLDFGVAEHAALMRTFEDFGILADEAVMRRYSQINSNCWRRLERGEISRSEVLIGRFRALFAEMALPGRAEEVNARYEEYLAREHAFVPGAPALLEALYGKYRLYIVSNGTAKIQYSRIAGADIGKYFDGIFISEEIGYDKPDRAFFFLLLFADSGLQSGRKRDRGRQPDQRYARRAQRRGANRVVQSGEKTR